MKQTFINAPEDMAWLREVHLPMLDKKYQSAILYGNEDCPDKIEVFEKTNPTVDSVKKTYVFISLFEDYKETV